MTRTTAILLALLALTGCVSMLPRRPQLSMADSYPAERSICWLGFSLPAGKESDVRF